MADQKHFMVDRKGDSQNLKYGSLDKYKVSKYRSAGYGRLIGLDRRFRVISDTGSERQIHDQTLDPANKDRTFPLQLKQQSQNDSSLPIRSRSNSRDDIALQKDYVELNNTRRRIPAGTDSTEQNSIRRLNSSRVTVDLPHFEDDSSDSESTESSLEDGLTQQSAFDMFKNHPDNKKFLELKNMTERDPTNATVWLDFIEHQERYHLFTTATDRKSLSAFQKRSVVEAKVALYERAIHSVSGNTAKEQLILGLMKEGAKIWDTNKQQQQWKAILGQHSSILLWLEYLNFEQSNTITFSYDTCLSTYMHIMKKITDLKVDNRDAHLVYLALRVTTFIHEAGYSERAIAVWQALLEFNFLSPKINDYSSLTPFKAFWEAEHPRIGEEKANGWCSTTHLEISTRTDRPLAHFDEEEQDLFRRWANAESERDKTENMPARMVDDTVEDDPYRVILFSDISDFLFRIETTQGASLLKRAFLIFCDLPSLSYTCGDNDGLHREWHHDPFIRQFEVANHLQWLTCPDETLSAYIGSHHTMQVDSQHQTPLFDFATKALEQLTEADKNDELLAAYTVSLVGNRDIKRARKLAKKLLKHKPNSLLLYNAYALLEVRSGQQALSKTVWMTSLSMTDSRDSRVHHDELVSWHSWVWTLLGNREYKEALALLTDAIPSDTLMVETLQRITTVTDFSASQNLRATAFYTDQIASSVAEGCRSIVQLTALFAILQYLRDDFKLDSALVVYESTMTLLSITSHSRLVERLHRERAKLAHFHATFSQSSYQPKQLIALFKDSMIAFPDSLTFFILHEKYLHRAGIIDRLRSVDLEGPREQSSVTHHLKTILREMSRPAYSGSTVHSIRHAFVAATDTDAPTRHCPSVWLAWLQWEASLLTSYPLNGQLAQYFKNAYLSALRSCPWCKELYMQAFTDYRTIAAVGERELLQVYRGMNERGLRIRHDIMELLDDRAE